MTLGNPKKSFLLKIKKINSNPIPDLYKEDKKSHY